MISWFILIFLIGIIADYLINGYNRSNVLNCGLFGYTGKNKPDPHKIMILGIFNDTRGGDSCGISVDTNIYKGIGKESKFVDFIVSMGNLITEIIEDPNTIDYTVIGHCRKKSVGLATEKNAHPFEILSQKNELLLIGAHNGTISNWITLCKKYDVDTKDINVDSHAIFEILAKSKDNYTVFKDYLGKGAFVFYSGEPNTMYVFKGASKDYVSSKTEEERPLYYYRENGGIYYSSIKDSLEIIGGDDKTIIPFECNILYKIKDGRMSKVKVDVDRSEVVNNQSTYHDNRYTAWENEEYGLVKHGQQYNRANTTPVKPHIPLGPVTSTTIFGYDEHELNYAEELRSFDIDIQITNFNKRMIHSKYSDKVYYYNGLYMRNGHVVGAEKPVILELDDFGYAEDHKFHIPGRAVKKYVFFRGYIMDIHTDEFLQKEKAREIYFGTGIYYDLNKVIKYTTQPMCDTTDTNSRSRSHNNAKMYLSDNDRTGSTVVTKLDYYSKFEPFIFRFEDGIIKGVFPILTRSSFVIKEHSEGTEYGILSYKKDNKSVIFNPINMNKKEKTDSKEEVEEDYENVFHSRNNDILEEYRNIVQEQVNDAAVEAMTAIDGSIQAYREAIADIEKEMDYTMFSKKDFEAYKEPFDSAIDDIDMAMISIMEDDRSDEESIKEDSSKILQKVY